MQSIFSQNLFVAETCQAKMDIGAHVFHGEFSVMRQLAAIRNAYFFLSTCVLLVTAEKEREIGTTV